MAYFKTNMRRCYISRGRDLSYTDSARHNTRERMVECFYNQEDGTRPPLEVGEPQEGEGLITAFNRGIANLSNAFPSNKDGLARPIQPGENHAVLKLPGGGVGRANFCGPGTRLDVRLKPPKAVARTPVDKVCEKHDLDYLVAQSSSDVRRADSRMIRNLSRVRDSRLNILPSKKAIQAKMKAEDYGLLSKTKFISGDPVGPVTLKRAKRRQRQLAQQGLGFWAGQEWMENQPRPVFGCDESPSELLLRSLKRKKKKG